jgi:prepilin-type N-terminal cleavage/methylation domain-containing protein
MRSQLRCSSPRSSGPLNSEGGFTLIELLVAIAIFAVISTSLYAVVFGGVRASNTSEDVVRVSEEARLGLNRMIRETREGQLFSALSPDSYRVRIDFDRDGIYENPNQDGDFESLEFRYDTGDDAILLNNQVLIAGVTPIDASTPIFSYTSNDLRYDSNRDGVTTSTELDQAAASGYSVNSADPTSYSNVEFAFRVSSGPRQTVFRGHAQLRNRR